MFYAWLSAEETAIREEEERRRKKEEEETMVMSNNSGLSSFSLGVMGIEGVWLCETECCLGVHIEVGPVMLFLAWFLIVC